MKPLLIIFFSLISISVLAQSDTIVTYSNIGGSIVKKIDKAVNIYKVYKKDSVSWVRTTSDKNYVILKKETFSDPKLATLNGPYVTYKNGTPKLKGYYVNGYRAGAWVTYDSTLKAIETKTYFSDNLNGLYTSYWEKGSVKEQGNYLFGKRKGEWIIFYEDGKQASKEIYNEEGKLTDSAYFDISEKPTKKENIKTNATFPGGVQKFYKYLAKSIIYPSEAAKSGVTGKVHLTFTVQESGEIEDIEVISTPDRSLAIESIRILKSSPKWIPATILGKPVVSRLNINTSFYLGRGLN